jgi:Cu2+-exporting ATPase
MTTVEPVVKLRGARCTHCGLPVPAGVVEPGNGSQFCCGGCRVAFEVIMASGLGRYYELAERRDTAVHSSGRRFEEFDHEAFQALYVTRRPDGLSGTELYLEGVHCASCVWLVERVPLAIPGVGFAELDVSRSLVCLGWDASRTSLSHIARHLDSLGYRPHPHRGLRADLLRRAEDRTMLLHIGVAGALAGNVMLVAMALYSGWFSGMDPGTERYFRWVSLALTTPALLGPGRVFFRGAWSAFKARALHMDVPVALALGAGYLRGAANTIRDAGPIYFDGVAALIFLLLVGRFLQHRAQRAAAGSAELLYSLAPTSARVLDMGNGESSHDVPTEALIPGMVLEVRAGETIAADGEVLEGSSALDLSLLSGEPRPVRVVPGDAVFAATINRTATLRIRVDAAGESSRVGRLLHEVESGARRRAPVVQLADRLTGTFVGVVLVLAAATFLFWLRVNPAHALDNAIALLVVTCPCALALATPLAVSVAIGRAARTGMLIKNGPALEALARPGMLYLDKTGTITEGRTSLERWEGEDRIRPLILALERHSTHPLAAGFREAWPDIAIPEAHDVVSTSGGGLEGRVGVHRVAIGAAEFIRDRLVGPPPRIDSLESLTPVWVVVDGRFAGRAHFGDPLRPDAAEVLGALRARGMQLRLLSGDAPAVVRSVGAATGFAGSECHGGITPEAKLAEIERAAQHGPVLMVGDGVNDAAAIARATVGIAVRGGAEASLAAADVYLGGGLAHLVPLLDGSRRTLWVIRRNIAFSLAYNVVGAVLAMTGVINPLIAAIMMPASSLTVVFASWQSRTFDQEPV